MRNVKNLTLCVLVLGLVGTATGAKLNVPSADYPTIQAAIDGAAPSGDEILVAPGTYLEAINFSGKAIWLHSEYGPDVTTIDGDDAYHVVQSVLGEGPDTVLEGFTITGGNADGAWPDDRGGGMYNSGSSPSVIDCIFTGNMAYRGAGMHSRNKSSPELTNCTFSDNMADAGGGMGSNDSSPRLINCTFSGNTADEGPGGAMTSGLGNPTLINCTFVGNTAETGGAMYNWYNDDLTVINCTFNGNTADKGFGGAMYNSGGSISVTNCTFEDNTAKQNGGGMFNLLGNPTVTNCTFSGNTANSLGGGMYNDNSNPTVTNCILWGDTGGEIMGGTPTVTYCDVEGGYTGPGNIDADPMFADTDGRLSPGSPCIDAGSDAAVPTGVTTDLDGNPRIQGGAVDMGAFEAPPSPEAMLATLALFIQGEVKDEANPEGTIDAELENSLLVKVNAALSALERGNPNDAKVAMNDLKALINQVEAQTDKKIALLTAEQIITLANQIIAALGG